MFSDVLSVEVSLDLSSPGIYTHGLITGPLLRDLFPWSQRESLQVV